MIPLFSLSSIIILAAKSGSKTPASNALIDIISIKTEFVVKFRELANSSINKKESAKNATKDTVQSTEDANKSVALLPPTLDVPSGLMDNVNLAPRDGSSMKKKSASQSVISATPGKKTETAPLVTMDPLFKRETVLLTLTLLLCPKATSSVKLGLENPVKHAVTEVSLMLMDCVSPLAHNVTLLIKLLEIVSLVLKDMTYSKDNVFSLLLTQ